MADEVKHWKEDLNLTSSIDVENLPGATQFVVNMASQPGADPAMTVAIQVGYPVRRWAEDCKITLPTLRQIRRMVELEASLERTCLSRRRQDFSEFEAFRETSLWNL